MQAAVVQLASDIHVFEVHDRTLVGLGRKTDVREGRLAPFGHVVEIHHQGADALPADLSELCRAGIPRLEEVLVRLVLAARTVVQDLQRLAPVDRDAHQCLDAGLDAAHEVVLAALEVTALALAHAALVAAAAFAVDHLRGAHLATRETDDLVALLIRQEVADDGDVRAGHHGFQLDLAVGHGEARQQRAQPDGRGRIARATGLGQCRLALAFGHALQARADAPDDADRMAGKHRVEGIVDHDLHHVVGRAAAQHVGGDPVLPAVGQMYVSMGGRRRGVLARSGLGRGGFFAHGPD